MWTFGAALGVIAGVAIFGFAWAVKRSRPSEADVPKRSRPVSFGYKTQWLAIRGVDPRRVVEALELVDARPSGWREGIAAGYGESVFVSPSIDGWILVVGSSLPSFDTKHGDEPLRSLLVELSRSLDTEVQYFGTHRIVEYHAWARADRGRLLRAYAYIGESGATVIDEGLQTNQEQAIGFRLFDERAPEADVDAYRERTDISWPDEESVMRVAGAWSINPTTLDGWEQETGPGWLGRWKN